MVAYSHSPRVSGPEMASLQAYGPNPITPTHSPHPSIRSSLSLRTPVHTLTLHEYRKQQSTPIPRIEAAPGKTLRRKTAVFALNELERVPSATLATQSNARSSLRSLQSSQSAHQLLPQPHSLEPLPIPDQSFRSLSAEPRVQSSSTKSAVASSTSSKFRQFSARKRLPRPTATGSRAFLPPIDTELPNHLAQSPQLVQPELPSRASLFANEPRWSDAQSTSTPSTFSLSRFPRPPQLADPSFSPPPEEKDPFRVNAFSFATTAPATPPATPAIIHYRGTSFDLINPHDSLLYHDIVTPSRDLDSSEYLPLRTSEDQLAITPEMAPKRALYGDLNAAHAGIMRRAEDSFDMSNLDLPLLPTPAAISPNSSDYTSPFYSPESNLAPSPLHVRKPAHESRFSIKGLTRTLTKRLGKSPDQDFEEEMKEFCEPILRTPSTGGEDPYPRPLDPVYVPAPSASYFTSSPVSPVSPTSPELSQDSALLPGYKHHDQNALDRPQISSAQEYASEGLASLIPDDPSIEVGRAGGPRVSMAEKEHSSRPYYDDLESIYASSSIYTADDQRRSRYEQSLASNRQSRAFFRFSGMNASEHAQKYSYDNLRRTSHSTSRPFTQELYHRSVVQGPGKTDTISKFIDQYDPDNTVNNSLSLRDDHAMQTVDVVEPDSADVEEESRVNDTHPMHQTPNQSQSESGIPQTNRALQRRESVARLQPVLSRRFASTREPGLPPSAPAPLAPAFEYDEMPYLPQPPAPSELYSRASDYSYGDTRNLLRIAPEGTSLPVMSQECLQPSSSYSQPETKAIEPSSSYSQEDGEVPKYSQYTVSRNGQQLDNSTTEKIQKDQEIPAMWARRGSMSLPRNKRRSHRSSAGYALGDDKAEWETVDGESQQGRLSLDSIANYSSSEESELLNTKEPFPQWNKTKHSRFLNYIHPSPLRSHANPFSSSPPHLETRASIRTAPEIFSPTSMSSPPMSSTTTPVFHYRSRPIDYLGNGTVEEPRDTPWESPYTLSNKETQELLASGPNDDILFDTEPDRKSQGFNLRSKSRGPKDDMISDTEPNYEPQWFSSPVKSPGKTPTLSSSGSLPVDVSVERENTFLKLSSLGSKGNLTGTPRGTGMQAVGSSIADNSSPGVGLSYRVGRQRPRAEYNDFYACPYPATGSVTRIKQRVYPEAQPERSPSEVTLFPSAYSLEPVQPSSPLAGPASRVSLGNSTKFRRARQPSRPAVPGQTKLREMVLASSGTRTSISSHETHFSQFMHAGRNGRPSTSDTTTPLRSADPSMNTFADPRPIVAHTHSPHLLCPKREVKPEDEEQRRKLSWLIFAMFCVFPPCMFLYRMWGDSIVVSVTKGQLGHCTAKSKRVALIAGILVNLGLITAVLVPVLVAQAWKTV